MIRRILSAIASIAILAGCADAVATTSPVASAPSRGPAGTPTTTTTATARPTVAPLSIGATTFPASGYGFPSIAAGPDGGIWVVVTKETLHTSSSIVALLGPDLKPRAGWPLLITGWICGSDSNSGGWAPQPTASGGTRIVCRISDGGVGDPLLGIELDVSGRLTGTWHSPVRYWWDYRPRFVDDRLVGFGREVPDQEGATEPPTQPITYWITSAGRDGSVALGPRVTARVDPPAGVALGPDGTGYLFDDLGISAFGMAGPLLGWPIDLAADRSLPGFLNPPAIVLTRTATGSGSMRVVRLGDGRVADLSAPMDMTPIPAFNGVAQEKQAIAPLVAGAVTTVIGGTGTGLIVRQFTDTEVHGGWPFETRGSLDTQGSCDASGIFTPGCGVWTTLPALAPDGTLLLALAPKSRDVGPQILAIGPDGGQLAGWPVVVGKPGTHVWSLAGGGLGGVYAVVVDGAGGGGAGTQIISVKPDGTVLARLTVATA